MLLIAGLLLIGGFAALVIVNPRPAGSAKLQVEVTAKGLHPTFVGDHGGEDFVIVNSSGHRIDNLTVFVADGQDNWLDHHVVTMLSSACTINRALRAFECGPLTAGQTFDLTVLATAKDAGNFNYGWGVANQVKGGGLEQWNDEVTWSEAVRP